MLLIQDPHGAAAAAGDGIARLQMQELAADVAVDITFLLGLDHGNQAAFQFIFHSNTSLQKGVLQNTGNVC